MSLNKAPEIVGAIMSYLLNMSTREVNWLNHAAATLFAIMAGIVVHVFRIWYNRRFKDKDQ